MGGELAPEGDYRNLSCNLLKWVPISVANLTVVLPFRLDFTQKPLNCILVPNSSPAAFPPQTQFLINIHFSFPQSLMSVAVNVTSRIENAICQSYYLPTVHRELPYLWRKILCITSVLEMTFKVKSPILIICHNHLEKSQFPGQVRCWIAPSIHFPWA